MMYNKLVERYFFEPKHLGTLDCSQPQVYSSRTGNSKQGGYFDLYVLCDNERNIVTARFKAYGSPYLIAGLEWLCGEIEGTSIDEHPMIDYDAIMKAIGMLKRELPVAVLIVNGYSELITSIRGKR